MSGLLPEIGLSDEGIARIRLRRPLAANRIELKDLEVLQSAVSEFDADEKCKVLLIEAQGAVFSAGFDLRSLCEGGDESRLVDVEAFERFANSIAAARFITIAALNGPAIGGASDLALACDLRIGVSSAGVRMPAAQFGLPLYPGALRRYVQAFGLPVAKNVIFSGDFVSADELFRLGLLKEIVESEMLSVRAVELSRLIAEMPAAPLQAMKRGLNLFAATPASERELRNDLFQTFDGTEIATRIDRARKSAKSRHVSSS